MTIAHWRLPFGAFPEAFVDVTARVPAATTTPTTVSFRNSRRLMFISLMAFLIIMFYCTMKPAFEPGSQYHAAGKTDQTGQGGKPHRANRIRLWCNRSKLHFRGRFSGEWSCYSFCCLGLCGTMHLVCMAGVAGIETGIEGMIGHTMRGPVGISQMLHMAVDTGNSLLIMGSI